MKPPIADPQGSPSRFAGTNQRAFRLKFWPYFLATLGAALVALAVLLVIEEPGTLHQESLIVALGFGVGAGFLGCAFVWWTMPLKTNEWGLRSVTFWATPREVAWSEMSRVSFVWMGVPYAVVSSPRGPKTWVWLSLEDTRGFAQAVASHTAPDHPLHQFLRQRGLLG